MKATAIPWEEINEYILSLANIPTLSQFAADALAGLQTFLYFDRALAYFFDGNGRIRGQHLMNYDKQWSKLYLDYYSKLQSVTDLSIMHNVIDSMTTVDLYNRASFSVTDWTQECDHEFMSDYIKACGLQFSLNFNVFDTRGSESVLFALDRLTYRPFTKEDIAIAKFVIPHLNALNKKYFFRTTDSTENLLERSQVIMELSGLTRREKEIALQLCSGISPASVSKRFHITNATTHKHIAHIYAKLHVSNLQEMLVCLLNPQANPQFGFTKEERT